MIFRWWNLAATGGRALTELALVANESLCGGAGRPPTPGRKRVAFQAYSIHLAQHFRSTIQRLRDHPSIEVRLVLLPHPQFPRRTLEELARYARTGLGLPDEAIRPYRHTLHDETDLVICADVYARFPRRRTRTCLVAHGPCLTSRFFEPSPLRKTIQDFDVVAVNGRYDLDLARRHAAGAGRPVRIADVGFPYLDDLLALRRNREALRPGHGLEPRRPVVVYAPHWQPLRRAGAWRRVRDVVASLRSAGVNVLIKPHACSLNRAMSNGVDWRSRFDGLIEPGRVAVDFDCDDIVALVHADALVTERSSRGFNAMLAGIPLLVLDGERVEEADRLEACRMGMLHDGAARVGNVADIVAYLRASVESWRPGARASEIAGRTLSLPGSATDAFVRFIEEEAGVVPGVEAPARVSGSRVRSTPVAATVDRVV